MVADSVTDSVTITVRQHRVPFFLSVQKGKVSSECDFDLCISFESSRDGEADGLMVPLISLP